MVVVVVAHVVWKTKPPHIPMPYSRILPRRCLRCTTLSRPIPHPTKWTPCRWQRLSFRRFLLLRGIGKKIARIVARQWWRQAWGQDKKVGNTKENGKRRRRRTKTMKKRFGLVLRVRRYRPPLPLPPHWPVFTIVPLQILSRRRIPPPPQVLPSRIFPLTRGVYAVPNNTH